MIREVESYISNRRILMKRMVRLSWMITRSVALMLAITMGIGIQLSGTSAAASYKVNVGGGSAGISVDMFRPNVLFINQGDTVEFVNPYEEIHTVTHVANSSGKNWFAIAEEVPFIIDARPEPSPVGPPKLAVNPKVATPTPASGAARIREGDYANSGILFKGQSWTATFTEIGTFKFICVLHPFMEISVNSLPPTKVVATQSQLDDQAAAQLGDQVAKGEAAAAAVRPGKSANADGSTTWEVLNAAPAEAATPMRFIPQRLQIGVGDTVHWRNETPVPHTVTFNATAPDFIIPEPQQGGPPLLTLDPKVLFPVVPSKQFDGTGYVNSGFLGVGPEATGGPSFSLTFSKAGTYRYICVLHADQGMAGVIEVGTQTGITPPSTGDAGLSRATSLYSWLYAPLLAVLISLVGASASIRALYRR
jgi:plastocyanin